MSLYEVCLKSLELFGYHGVLEEEKKNGQYFYIDIRYAYNKNSNKDDIDDALDYSQVYSVTKQVFGSKGYNLLESLANDISNAIMKNFDEIQELEVGVKKKNPPIGGKSKFVRVSVKEKK